MLHVNPFSKLQEKPQNNGTLSSYAKENSRPHGASSAYFQAMSWTIVLIYPLKDIFSLVSSLYSLIWDFFGILRQLQI